MPEPHDTPARRRPSLHLRDLRQLSVTSRDPRAWIVVLVLALGVTLLVTADRSFMNLPRARASETTNGTVSLREPDGGTSFYSRFTKSLPADPTFFPIGVWLESVTEPADHQKDREAGINMYVGITRNSDLSLVENAGMHVLAQQEEWLDDTGRSSAAVAGWMLTDEIDMTQGPVEGPKTLDKVKSGLPKNDGRLHYSNYGKGVTFWETDAEAAVFVNDYQDVVSADNYWFTDRDICGVSQGGVLLGVNRALTPEECHLAANYGRTIDRVRALIEPASSKPVWHFVEVGHPFSEDDWPTITPAQVRAAVWSGIIHGARGVVYFNHSFGGPDETQHALRDPAYAAVRDVVTSTNAQLTELAPVLNGPTVLGLVTNTQPVVTKGVTSDAGTTTTGSTDVLVKRHDGRFYVLAGSASQASHTTTFSMPCVGDATATVLGENRTIDVEGGTFRDTFADGNAVHLYRIDGGSACGLS